MRGRRMRIGGFRLLVVDAACCLILGVSLIGLTGAARAQDAALDPGKRGAARTKLVEGDRLLKQGEFQQALTAFKSAYDLYPSPKIHYNFGLAYEGMGRNADALDAFDAFLAGALDAQPEVREKARANRDALLMKIALVRVSADVDGATIVVDGREIGKTPYPHDVRLDPGSHLVLVDRGGGTLPFMRRVELAAGASLSVAARFSATGGAAAAVTPAAGATRAGATQLPAANADTGRRAGQGGDTAPSSGSASLLITKDTTKDTTTDTALQPSAPTWVRPAAWTVGGLAVAAVAVGAIGWIVKENKYRAFNRSCNKALSDDGGGDCPDLLSTGDDAKTVAIGAFISAAVLGAASAGMFVWDRRSAAEGATGGARASFTCAPILGSQRGGLCGVRF